MKYFDAIIIGTARKARPCGHDFPTRVAVVERHKFGGTCATFHNETDDA
jgi:hypothetical protein